MTAHNANQNEEWRTSTIHAKIDECRYEHNSIEDFIPELKFRWLGIHDLCMVSRLKNLPLYHNHMKVVAKLNIYRNNGVIIFS
jgi:hypothetical protein